MFPPRLQPWLWRLLALVLLFNLALLAYYAIVNYQAALHADSAVMNLLAQEIRDTGQFFPSSWYYANGDLWIVATQLPVLLLLPLWPNTFALHAVSSLLTAVLVLSGAWCVGAMLGQSRRARLLLLTVLAGGISVNMAENLYGQAAYGVLFGLGCLIAHAGWRLLHARAAARWRWGGWFALLLLLVCWSNPQRALVFYVLPLLSALLAMGLAPDAHAGAAAAPGRRAIGLCAALLCAALLAGAALHGYVVRHVGSSGLPPPAWLDFDGMLRNTLGTLRGLFSLLGGLPRAGTLVASAAGVTSALRLAAALTLLALLPWAVRRALAGTPARRYFAVYIVVAAAINLLVALATTLPDMSAPEASVRYLVPVLLSALILLPGNAVDEFHWSRVSSVAAVAALLVLSLTGLRAYEVDGAPRYFPKGGIANNHVYGKFASYLRQQGLRHGYSTFWNAGTITVLSEGALQQRPITIDHGLPMPVRHLSSSRWYEGEGYVGETYLMLNYDEVKQVDWNLLASYIGQPLRVLDFGGCKIYVYPHNIAPALPLWDLRRSPPLRIAVNAATPHHIGALSEDDHALRAQPGEAGHLRYGSVVTPPPGRYLVSFDLETHGDQVAEYGMVDVAINNGANVLANQAIRASGRQRLTMPLTLPQVQSGVEIRVLSNGAGSVTLRDIELSRQP